MNEYTLQVALISDIFSSKEISRISSLLTCLPILSLLLTLPFTSNIISNVIDRVGCE